VSCKSSVVAEYAAKKPHQANYGEPKVYGAVPHRRRTFCALRHLQPEMLTNSGFS
jgi:hypothetical protein